MRPHHPNPNPNPSPIPIPDPRGVHPCGGGCDTHQRTPTHTNAHPSDLYPTAAALTRSGPVRNAARLDGTDFSALLQPATDPRSALVGGDTATGTSRAR